MGLWSNLVQRFAGAEIQQLVDLRLREALPAGLVDQDDQLWRRVSRRTYEEDTFVVEIALQQAYKLYLANPLAKWCLEMTRDLITAEGVEVSSDDERVQDVLQAFWTHDLNQLDINLPQMVLELGLFGEQCWPAFLPDSGSGILSLGLIASDTIKEVIHDPGNCALPIGVVLKDQAGQDGAKLRIIYNKPDEELFTQAVQDLRKNQFTDGETFWFKINTVRHSSRGLSDLFSLSDWLDGYEELLFNLRDRDADLRAFAWDVTLSGYDQGQINAWLAATEKPRPGSWFAHNESVVLEAKTPQLNAGDTTLHSRLYRNHIIGSLGFPEHWMGGGGDVNRSTAEAMHTPTMKRYTQRQRYVRYMIDHVIKHQLRVAAEGGLIAADQQDNYKIDMPQMVTEDLTKIAAALQSLSAAAMAAQQQGWIDADTAQRLFATVASRMGAEVPQDGALAVEQQMTSPDYPADEDEAQEGEEQEQQVNESRGFGGWE